MKKKFRKFLLPILCLLVVPCTACQKETPFTAKVHIDYGDYRENNISDIMDLNTKISEFDELTSLRTNKESFVLVIYNKDPDSCSCWNNFKRVLKNYYNETHMRMYLMQSTLFEAHTDKYGLYTVPGDMPSLAIFNRGSLVYQIVYGRDNQKVFYDDDTFKSFMDAHIVLPKFYYLKNSESLDAIISKNVNFNVYFMRGTCGDCKAINGFLHSWVDSKNNNASDNMYVIDIDAYRDDQEIYKAFKDKYGLSDVNNPILGWGEGMVPTFQNRTGNTINDMITVYNDTWNPDSKLVTSYFTKTRIDNMPFLEGHSEIKPLDQMEVPTWDKTSYCNQYHNPITQLFLDTYIK